MPKQCNKDECVNNVWGKGYCKYHQYLRKDKNKKKPLKKSPLKKVYKPTGELALFKEIWEERKKICFVSGEVIENFSVQCFAHVLPKGSYPTLRLDKENIVLVKPEIHYIYDHQVDKAKETPMFKELLDLKQRLKEEFYRKNKLVG
jgi:hypothetical protein